MAAFICKRQVAPKYYMGGVFRDYVLFASLFIGTLHAEGKLDDHGKTLSISLLFVSFFIRRFFIKKPPHV
jgi:hypothetical protein